MLIVTRVASGRALARRSIQVRHDFRQPFEAVELAKAFPDEVKVPRAFQRATRVQRSGVGANQKRAQAVAIMPVCGHRHCRRILRCPLMSAFDANPIVCDPSAWRVCYDTRTAGRSSGAPLDFPFPAMLATFGGRSARSGGLLDAVGDASTAFSWRLDDPSKRAFSSIARDR